MELFEKDWGINNSEFDDTEITTTILYFSKIELAKFRKLCKLGIKKEFANEFQEKGNIPDLLLKILTEKYENL
jgi:hypothetical protein